MEDAVFEPKIRTSVDRAMALSHFAKCARRGAFAGIVLGVGWIGWETLHARWETIPGWIMATIYAITTYLAVDAYDHLFKSTRSSD